MARSKNKGGRPTALTPAVHDEIVKHLRAGAFLVHAAAAAGIAKRTVLEWIERGERGDAAYRAFYIDVQRERALDAIRAQSIITRAQLGTINGDWKAAAWTLERKYPREYGAAAAAAARITVDHGSGDRDGEAAEGAGKTRVEFYLPNNHRRPEEQQD